MARQPLIGVDTTSELWNKGREAIRPNAQPECPPHYVTQR